MRVILADPPRVLQNTRNAVQVLLDKGVLESRIVFLSLIAAPEGIHRICKKFPRMKVVTSEIDEGLNSTFQVVPGNDRMPAPCAGTIGRGVPNGSVWCNRRLRRVWRPLLVGIRLSPRFAAGLTTSVLLTHWQPLSRAKAHQNQ